MNDRPAVTIRNRHTGEEKNVSENTAKIIMDTHAFNKDWEVLSTPQPTPGVVIQFQEAKLKEMKKDSEGVYLDPKKEPDIVKIPDLPLINTSKLSIKKLKNEIEFLNETELNELLKDERITARKMAEAELLKRKS